MSKKAKRRENVFRILAFIAVFISGATFYKLSQDYKMIAQSYSEMQEIIAPEELYLEEAIEQQDDEHIEITPTSAPLPDWSVEKVDDIVTKVSYPADARMSTPSELFDAVNAFRKANSVNTLLTHETLCRIASARAQEIQQRGSLDNHDGFKKHADAQGDFRYLGEVLHAGSQPSLGVHIVEYGWARSLTGHREALLTREYSHGCGGIAGFFAVFILGYN